MKKITNDFKATPAQKRVFQSCKKKIQKIFDKYQAQGLLTLQGHKKTCFGNSPIPYTTVLFEAQAITGQMEKNFGIWLSMDKGVDFCCGLASTLLTFRGRITDGELREIRDQDTNYQKFKDKDKWISFFEKIIAEIEKETVLERFAWMKDMED